MEKVLLISFAVLAAQAFELSWGNEFNFSPVKCRKSPVCFNPRQQVKSCPRPLRSGDKGMARQRSSFRQLVKKLKEIASQSDQCTPENAFLSTPLPKCGAKGNSDARTSLPSNLSITIIDAWYFVADGFWWVRIIWLDDYGYYHTTFYNTGIWAVSVSESDLRSEMLGRTDLKQYWKALENVHIEEAMESCSLTVLMKCIPLANHSHTIGCLDAGSIMSILPVSLDNMKEKVL